MNTIDARRSQTFGMRRSVTMRRARTVADIHIRGRAHAYACSTLHAAVTSHLPHELINTLPPRRAYGLRRQGTGSRACDRAANAATHTSPEPANPQPPLPTGAVPTGHMHGRPAPVSLALKASTAMDTHRRRPMCGGPGELALASTPAANVEGSWAASGRTRQWGVPRLSASGWRRRPNSTTSPGSWRWAGEPNGNATRRHRLVGSHPRSRSRRLPARQEVGASDDATLLGVVQHLRGRQGRPPCLRWRHSLKT